MKNRKEVAPLAKVVEKTLKGILRADANSTSCFVFYQPKMPKEIFRFKKSK